MRASSAAEIRRGMRRGRRAHGRGESLARSEREATADLIAHLAELDARRLYLGAGGFSSLFSYCTDVLRLSEAEAYNRIEAARAARRFPAILDMLGDGRPDLTTVRLLAAHLDDDNQRELLAAASRKSRRQVEELPRDGSNSFWNESGHNHRRGGSVK